MKGGHMDKSKLIFYLILVFLLGALVGIWGFKLGLDHRLWQYTKGEHHGAMAKPDMSPQNPQEKGEQPNP